MSKQSTIEWTDTTWNPVTGCDRVSPGCAHCYALDLAARLKAMGQARYQQDGDPKTSGPGFGVTLHPDKLGEPLRWRKPRMVFVNSMSDLFHEEIPDGYIARVFAAMVAAPQHTFQVLTKRPERMQPLLSSDTFCELVQAALQAMVDDPDDAPVPRRGLAYGLENVWLGVSIENRRFVGRADVLRQTPAAVRFISAEPLLGPLVYDTHGQIAPNEASRVCVPCFSGGGDPLAPELDLTGVDWLIVGGESGPEHRPIREEWVRDLRDAALASATAFFFKQWGGRTPKAGGRELDERTWDEFPRARS